MTRSLRWLLGGLVLGLVAALVIFLIRSDGRSPRAPAAVRPPDPAQAVAIPDRAYLVIPNELVVLLRGDRDLEAFRHSLPSPEIRVVGAIPEFRVVQVEVPASRREALKAELERHPLVLAVTYHSVFRAQAALNDPALTNEDPVDDWGLQVIRAPAAWDLTRGSPDVRIGVVDSGVRLSHEEVRDRIVAPTSLFSEDGSQVGDAEQLLHGTHVAVIAAGAGDNGAGISGVCPTCSVIPVQVEYGGSSLVDILWGVDYAIQHGATVVNLSLGPAWDPDLISAYHDPAERPVVVGRLLRDFEADAPFALEVFRASEDAGVVVVASAGNDDLPGDVGVLCNNPFVLCVGAAEPTEAGTLAPAPFSNYGFMVRVAAPGVEIVSAGAGSDTQYVTLSGTSMAAPYVAGLAGLMRALTPTLTPEDIRQAILTGAHDEAPPWFDSARAATRDLDLWRRAWLLLLGRDQALRLGNMAQHVLVTSIPVEANRLWDSPPPPATDGVLVIRDKAAGALVDARAALEHARDGTFRGRFLALTDADLRQLLTITPEHLVQAHDVLALAGRYAGSPALGGGFTLAARPSLDGVTVTRDQDPGGGYTEELVWIAPGEARHVATFRDQDYSQGPVRLQTSGATLTLTNLWRGLELAYAVGTGPALAAAAAPEPFCSIAGGCEPTTYGELLVTFLGPSGTPTPEDLWITPATGGPGERPVLATGQTGQPLRLPAGRYDLTIPVHPAIWLRGVEIPSGGTVTVEAGGYGQVLVRGVPSGGAPVSETVFVFDPEDPAGDVLTTGTTNAPLDLLASRYRLVVDLDPDLTYEDVEVTRGQVTTIDLPAWGRLLFTGTTGTGEPIRQSVWVYPAGAPRDEFLSSGTTNALIDLPPGRYDCVAALGPNAVFEGLEVRPGETTTVALPGFGSLVLRGTGPDGQPLEATFYVYPAGDRGTPVTSSRVNAPLDLPAGTYDLSVDLNPDIPFPAVVVPAGQRVELTVPQWGEVALSVTDAAGQRQVHMIYLVHTRQDPEPAVFFSSDRPKLVPPGTYLARVDADPDVWLEDPITIHAGERVARTVTLAP